MSRKNKNKPEFKKLISGIDTLECAYFLHSRKSAGVDYNYLAQEKEALQKSKYDKKKPILLGNEKYVLKSHGTASGYPYVIENENFRIQLGEFNQPQFFVTFKSEALWRASLIELHKMFLELRIPVVIGR